jgi:phage repressor protein C with HTH and peptisase S24 domain
MTEEEKKLADAKEAEAKGEGKQEDPAVIVDPIAEKDKEIAKLKGERDNYKAVALKRLGKLPNDAEFLGGEEDEKELSVSEQIKLALLEKEVESKEKEREDEIKHILKENSELRLALKNRPDISIGGDGGSSKEVKDNVFSTEQIAELKKRAERLKVDPDKFVENAKRNFLARKS